MIIGVPKEIKDKENRVGLVPSNVHALVEAGHTVYIQEGAGLGSGFPDEDYVTQGAQITTQDQAWQADLVVKVKEPLESEYGYFREGLLLFTYLHLAANLPLIDALIAKKVIGIAYETIRVNGHLPLLQPMSEIAGRYAIQIGATLLESHMGGKGKLLGGVPGVAKGNVVIIGGGVVGEEAARIGLGMGANVTVLDINSQRLADLENIFNNRIQTHMADPYTIGQAVTGADLVIGAVLVPGRKAPVLVTEKMIKSMEPGSVVIDIAIDQGGNFETSKQVTTHSHPTYKVHDITHYTVANIPGAVPQTASVSLTNASLPYVLQLANKGFEGALKVNPAILSGVNTYLGHLTNEDVAISIGQPYEALADLV